MRILKGALAICFLALLLSSFKEKGMTWIAIGDSITYLNDHPNETDHRITKGYLTLVTEHFPNLHYINKGYNGWTSAMIADHIDSLGLKKADVYSIFLGTNDWWQGRPVGTLDDYKNSNGNGSVYGSFRIIVDKLHNLNPQAKILLITPMQRADFVYINDHKNVAYGSYKDKNGQSLEAFAEAINAIGAYEHIPVVDLFHDPKLKVEDMVRFKRLKDPKSGTYVNYRYPRSTVIPFNAVSDEYPYPKKAMNITFDGLHPSDKGYKIIAKDIINQVERYGLLDQNKLD